MAVKTFTDNTSLPASDINTYLNNGGLVYIKSQTVGSAITSVAVSSAFSSDFDNYRIIYQGGTASTDIALTFALTGSTVNYYAGIARCDATGAVTGLATNNQASFTYAGMASTDAATMEIEVFEPNVAKFTRVRTSWIDTRTNNAWGTGAGIHRVATAYTGFTLGVSSGSLTGGTITVYGYRKA